MTRLYRAGIVAHQHEAQFVNFTMQFGNYISVGFYSSIL